MTDEMQASRAPTDPSNPVEGDARRSLRHDLRTAVNHITSSAQLAMDEADEEGLASVARELEGMLAQARQMLALIDLAFGESDGSINADQARSDLHELALSVGRDAHTLGASLPRGGDSSLAEDIARVPMASERLIALLDQNAAATPADRVGSRSPARPSGTPVRAQRLPSGAAQDPRTTVATVLVVDDDEDNRDALKRHLERLGYAALAAENGREALEILGRSSVDVVLLDIMMPEMSGYEVLEARRESRALRDVPFIVISALDDIQSVVRCIEIGAEDYLPKPFDPVLLRARIGACIERKRFRDQEVAYLRDVSQVSTAARAVETRTFELDSLVDVASRADELGQLARVFQQMAREVYVREERHQALAQMVAGVAHEINTPLGVISTATSILRRELGSERISSALLREGAQEELQDLSDTLGLMSSNIDRLHRLVQSFKNMSVSQVVDELEQFDLPELVAECLDLYRVSAQKAGVVVELKSDLPDDRRAWLGYRGLLSQVLLNLVTNVERYAYPTGSGGRAEVHLGVVEDDRRPCFVISVQDFGQGIRREDLPRVFDPFFTTGRSKGGSGLGLAIVQTIVTTALGGRVTIDSEPGRGTTVNVVIPQKVEVPAPTV